MICRPHRPAPFLNAHAHTQGHTHTHTHTHTRPHMHTHAHTHTRPRTEVTHLAARNSSTPLVEWSKHRDLPMSTLRSANTATHNFSSCVWASCALSLRASAALAFTLDRWVRSCGFDSEISGLLYSIYIYIYGSYIGASSYS